MDDLLNQASNILLLSIKPRFVEKLLDGTKSTELRRIKPRLNKKDIVLIYATFPLMSLVGYGVVESVIADTPGKLWKMVETRSGISRSDYDSYYDGAKKGYAINFSSVRHLQTPVDLASLRSNIKGFHPPQSYRYLCSAMASIIVSGGRKSLANA